ncbi:GTP pyrophosphokinase [Dysgonomonas sp. ZJ709]|uniref:GTP pyrophosphokinase n=1 Tax=Dysgonomonas sp. ZJ709 TaxID=2709797 RepID=UPI0013ECB1AD|nr:GTP pyrophosphokinase [Dysgonomonas sp. ZJ709]
MKKILEQAIHIAVNAHFGQVDKADAPYIFHPLRVMQQVNSTEEKILAILHDVVEDTFLTFNDLIDKGIPKHMVITLRLLTREKDMPYEDYISKIGENPVATKIKIADLIDNMDASRLKQVGETDMERLQKYSRSLKYLKSVSTEK